MRGPKKNELVTLTISGYASDGAGVSRMEDGRVIFVKGALLGEVCRVQLLKVGKTAAWGRVEEVLSASPERRVPDCPYYPRCGGCQLRHMSYEEELAFKRDRVQEALRRLGGVEVEVSIIHGAPQVLRYRNKVQFPVGDGGIGFYRARSHQVIDVEDCLLQPVEATRLRDAVKTWMETYQISAYEEREHRGLLRHLYVRTNRRGEVLCALVVNGRELPRQEELITLLRQAEPKLSGVVLAVNRARTNVILGEEYRTLWGQDALEDELCDFHFRLSVPSFYQVNREQTEVLYSRALEFAGLSGGETVLDLYCGIGTITSVLAQKAGRVIGAEVVPQAVEDARQNALRNGLTNVEFLCGDAGEAARALADRGLRPEVVCVDPPRKGLSQEVIEAIVQMEPERVVYVSCDPGTLGRDVKLFAQQGYHLCRAEACDLFPRTVHVESVVWLQRKDNCIIGGKIPVEEET
jgi:23S rRNA (uracil1939-C5)-methyltransferase